MALDNAPKEQNKVRRKPGTPKLVPLKVRASRKAKVPFERHESLPKSIVDGKFTPSTGAKVYAWRTRAGEKPSWHFCEVIRASAELVDLWDETLGQWFSFDPRATDAPDVRSTC